MYKPPYKITPNILDLLAELTKLIGQYEGLMSPKPQVKLRKENRIKTVHGSLAIEGNTLTLSQATAIIENKKLVGPKDDIYALRNAMDAYDSIEDFVYYSIPSFLKAHKIFMNHLIPDAGRFRKSNVGVLKGTVVSHVAPKPSLVPELMENLFAYLKNEKKLNSIIRSCLAHYEIEFIHPFSDGNGRLGRFWQHLILTSHYPIFEYVPIESVIFQKQKNYYSALEASDSKGSSEVFIEFCLESIYQALSKFLKEIRVDTQTPESRLEQAKNYFRKEPFGRKDYLQFFKTLSTATASRDLSLGVKNRILKKHGDKATAKYQFQ